MIKELNGKEYELDFSYHSLLQLSDFSLKEVMELEDKPFLGISVARKLLFASANHDPKKKVSMKEVDDIIKDLTEKGEIFNLLTDLMVLLEESNFFKNLPTQ